MKKSRYTQVDYLNKLPEQIARDRPGILAAILGVLKKAPSDGGFFARIKTRIGRILSWDEVSE